MEGAIQPGLAMKSPASQPSWRGYIAELLRSPGRAKAALIGCCILMIVSPAGFSAMTPFTTASFAAATGRPLPEALLLFVAVPLLISPLVLPIAGGWVDRWGSRAVAVPASILYAATTAVIPLAGGTIWLLAVVLVAASVFGFMASLAVAFKVISSWFPRHRGIGFAFMGAVSSLSAAILSPVFEQVINGSGPGQAASAFSGIGWDGAYHLAAILIALTAVPTALFLLSEPRSEKREGAPAPGVFAPPRRDVAGIPMRQAVRSRTWIFITLFLALAAAGPMAIRQNAVQLFEQRGFDGPTIALSLSALFVASMVGLFAGGMILDRSNRPWVVVPILATVPIGIVIAYGNHGVVPLLFLSTSLLGFATGAESALGPFLIARYFGLKCFAQLQGLTLAISTLTLGLAPFLVSAVQTATGSYFVPIALLTLLTAIAPVLAALLPKYPDEWKHVREELEETP